MLSSGSIGEVGGGRGWFEVLVGVEVLGGLKGGLPEGSSCWFMVAGRGRGELLGSKLVVTAGEWV